MKYEGKSQENASMLSRKFQSSVILLKFHITGFTSFHKLSLDSQNIKYDFYHWFEMGQGGMTRVSIRKSENENKAAAIPNGML